ncbi:MAG: efflux RND transporter permease subunit [SAR324 cluster bacterium]|nr:efflux RND transporter permease subunit [SAR324 cluster bacterium]
MNPSKIALDHPSPVFILVIMIVLLGTASYRSLPRESAPDIQIPLLIVTIPYPGASPEDVESLITHKAELELQGTDQLKSIKSTSTEGAVSITLEFNLGFDVDEARAKVREALDRIRPELPADIEEPVITQINLSEQPMMIVNVSGGIGLVRLKEIAEDLQDRIETIPGILEVRRAGGLEKEVRIFVDPEKLQYYNLSLNQVSSTIQRENTNLPGGTITIGPIKYLIRVPGEFRDPGEIEGLVITAPGQVPIYVRDVARVVFGFKEQTSRSRLDGLESVTLSVIKRSGENLLVISNRVKEMIEEDQAHYGDRVHYTILSDQSEWVLKLVQDLENNIVTGFVLVLVVLLVVMGLRNAVFVAVAIPLSMLLSFMVLEALGFTLNFVVLFSLILALGLLVDNAIVIVENIYRHVSAGKPRGEAARVGIGEVAVPVFTSSLTTVVAFAPMIFMPGIVGEFMAYLPRTLIVTLASSLAVGLIITPVLCAVLMRAPRNLPPVAQDEFALLERSSILRAYRALLEWALRHRLLTLAATGVLFVAVTGTYGATTFRSKGVEFFPPSEPREAVITIIAPIGTTLDISDNYVRQVEDIVEPNRASTEAVVANVGSRRGSGSSSAGGATTFLSHVVLSFPNWENWVRRPGEVIADLRRSLGGLAGAELKLSKQKMGPPTGPPVNIELRGRDFAVMKKISEQIKAEIRDIPGLVDLTDNFDRSRPEIRVDIDREKIARMGLRAADVASMIRTAFNGRKVSVFRDGREEYDIVVQLDERFRLSPTDLETLYVQTPSGRSIPLRDVATVRTGPAYGSIRHIGLDRVVTISASADGVPGPVLLRQVQQRLTSLDLPDGYAILYTGENTNRREAQAFLQRSFLIALFLIFIVLVAQFNSLALPFIIMASVVLSLMGVFLGLMIHDKPFGIMMTGIGTISLAGIVVNNAIVMIDYIGRLRRRGMPISEAIITGGMVRLRPVLLTAITTILGLLPIAIGLDINFYRWPPLVLGSEGGTFWVPMAQAVMYGLAIATLLTLVIVPVLYSTVESAKTGLRSKLGRGQRLAPETTAA